MLFFSKIVCGVVLIGVGATSAGAAQSASPPARIPALTAQAETMGKLRVSKVKHRCGSCGLQSGSTSNSPSFAFIFDRFLLLDRRA